MPGGRATSSHRGSTAGHDHIARRAAPACGTAGSCKDDSPAPPIPTARRHWTVGSIRGILLHLSGVVDIPNDHQRRPGEDQVPGPSTFVAVTHFYHNLRSFAPAAAPHTAILSRCSSGSPFSPSAPNLRAYSKPLTQPNPRGYSRLKHWRACRSWCGLIPIVHRRRT